MITEIVRIIFAAIQWVVNKLSFMLGLLRARSPTNHPDVAIEDLNQLERTMRRIQTAILDSADLDTQDLCEKHRRKEFQEVAYDAEDLIEDFKYEVLHAKIQARDQFSCNSSGKEASNDLSSVVSVPVPKEFEVKARKIRERFDEIVYSWRSLRLMEGEGVRRQSYDPCGWLPSSSLIQEPLVIQGRHHDLENIIEALQIKDTSHGSGKVRVLAIVGMGGLGKTALAQLVYNDPRINEFSDLKNWVCVSPEQSDVTTVMKAIYTSLMTMPCDAMQLDDLQRILAKQVHGRVFFLVLDDVWNENPEFWHCLRSPFYHSLSTRILVTTRSEKVAKIMQTVPFYTLKCLDSENSWQLFKKVAFENQNPQEHANLLEIGRKITMKCGGLPLALKAIGSALHFEQEEDMWSAILESDLWDLEVGKNNILPALQLSYTCMPIHVKQCFMYLSLFPNHLVIDKASTVRFWASLGFLKTEGRKSVEDVLSGCFDDLQQRSMLQQIQYNHDGGFLIHDLVHKLAEFLAGESFARLDTEMLKSLPDKLRFLSVVVNELPKSVSLSPIEQSSSLRVLLILNAVNNWQGKNISIELHRDFFLNLTCLRALNFSYTGISNLPDSIGNLKQLRFLGLANTNIRILPESICCLHNLQTLDLLGTPLHELPRGIKGLVSLRHLTVEKWSYVCMPYGVGHLTNLVTLSAFNVERAMGCKISELQDLNNLSGELYITSLNNIRDVEEAVFANLRQKQQIRSLTLEWSHDIPETGNQTPNPLSNVSHDLVLEALQPHLNLEILQIYRYPGLSYPEWLGHKSYSRLVEVLLFGNHEISCSFLPALGRLPSLKNLLIQCMLNVKHVGHEFCSCDELNRGFPSLNTLEFKYMPRWIQWFGIKNGDFGSLATLKMVRCNELKCMPTELSNSLTKLVINHCRQLIALPFLPSLSNLTLMGDLNKYLLQNSFLPSLKSLEIGFSQNIRSFNLHCENLPSLECLIVEWCYNLVSINGLGDLFWLKEFKVDGCNSLMLTELPPLLQVLSILNCPQLREFGLGNSRQKESEKLEESRYLNLYCEMERDSNFDLDTQKFDHQLWPNPNFNKEDWDWWHSASYKDQNDVNTQPTFSEEFCQNWFFDQNEMDDEKSKGKQIQDCSLKIDHQLLLNPNFDIKKLDWWNSASLKVQHRIKKQPIFSEQHWLEWLVSKKETDDEKSKGKQIQDYSFKPFLRLRDYKIKRENSLVSGSSCSELDSYGATSASEEDSG